MKSKDIREKFIKFFTLNGHERFNSSSLVPDDETLLFTTAGMVQLVPYLLREKDIDFKRVCSTQKSFRTSDIENVGNDGRHLTFFEMLGSWSFGDYYKEEAIELAFDLLTKEFKLPKDKLWVTIFKGNKNIPRDSESYIHWQKLGFSSNRIIELEEDNFWGPTSEEGPCGPSTEIYYDQGNSVCNKDMYSCCKNNKCIPGCDCDRYLEIWNAGVFMEYFKNSSGVFSKLPFTNVDTGAGLERLSMVLQNKTSVFETDLFSSIIDIIRNDSSNFNINSANLVADHIKSIVFLVLDGVLPSNEHRGYILRRITRRLFYNITILGYQDNLCLNLVEEVLSIYEGIYFEKSDRNSNLEKVLKVIREEDIIYSNTVLKGIKNLEKLIDKGKISGEDLFKLHDTYGLNIDMSKDILLSRGLDFDEKGFNDKMKQQQERSRMNSSFSLGKSVEKDFSEYPKTEFLGYDILSLMGAEVLYAEENDGEIIFILNKTTFYAEGGGQIGDSGKVMGNNLEVAVSNVKKTKLGVYLHFGKLLKGKMKEGDIVNCYVDKGKRENTSFNHTAVHLLNKAMKIVLGDTVSQKGAFIDSDRIRFDFNLDRALSSEEIEKIEDIVNENISKNENIQILEKNFDEVKKMGIDLAFEDRYDKTAKLRVVKIGDFSIELCGGTHFGNTGKIGKFKIVKQESASKGIRRIRAILEK